MTRFAGNSHDAHLAAHDFGHFHLEQLEHQAWVAAAHDYLWPALGLANFDQEHLESAVGRATQFVGHLLGEWHDALAAAHVDDEVLALGVAVWHQADTASNNLAFFVAELVVLTLVFHFTNSLTQHGAKRGCGNATEFVTAWCVVTLVDPVAITV